MGGDQYLFDYNGLGDRLRQTVNGAATDYTLDLVSGLTQVLADGTNVYLYGVGRIGEQQPEGWQFHLGDALGSVRQLEGASAAGTLSQAYEPFGSVLSSSGEDSTAFQFTGEQMDETRLVYLRARYYAPGQGRFMTRDVWEGDQLLPITLHPWMFAHANPILYVDPSGQCIPELEAYGECSPPMQETPPTVSDSGAKDPTNWISWARIMRCPEGPFTSTEQKAYRYYVENEFSPYPEVSTIGSAHAYQTLKHYEEARRELFIRYGWSAIQADGMIRDRVFMALVLASEVGNLRHDRQLYDEAVEALSNQYHGETKEILGPMRCRGKCNLLLQLRWATQMEAIYGREDFASTFAAGGLWESHIEGAQRAINGFAIGADTSWFWGNIEEERLVCYQIVVKRRTNTYPGKPYFIIYSDEDYGCNP